MGAALVLIVISIVVFNYNSAKVCEGSSSAKECRVVVSCKEKDPDQNSIEVEVQKLPESVQIVKFSPRADGTRTATATIPVTAKDIEDSNSKFESIPPGSAVLDIDKRAQSGVFEEPADTEQGKVGLLCEELN